MVKRSTARGAPLNRGWGVGGGATPKRGPRRAAASPTHSPQAPSPHAHAFDMDAADVVDDDDAAVDLYADVFPGDVSHVLPAAATYDEVRARLSTHTRARARTHTRTLIAAARLRRRKRRRRRADEGARGARGKRQQALEGKVHRTGSAGTCPARARAHAAACPQTSFTACTRCSAGRHTRASALQLTKLLEQNEVLQRNISCLFKTAQAEVLRKDRTISELRTQYATLPAAACRHVGARVVRLTQRTELPHGRCRGGRRLAARR